MTTNAGLDGKQEGLIGATGKLRSHFYSLK